MPFKRYSRLTMSTVLLLFTAAFLATASHAAEVTMEFFGNRHFRFVSTTGKVILINPWIKGNRDFPYKIDFYKKGEVDLILPTSGHGDDQGQSVEIAARTGAKIFVVSELGKIMTKRLVKMGGKKKKVYRGAIAGARRWAASPYRFFIPSTARALVAQRDGSTTFTAGPPRVF